MFDTLPRSHEVVRTWTWLEFAPYHKNLMERPLTPETLDTWMKDETLLSSLIIDTYYRLQVAHTCDTTNEEIEKQYHAFVENVLPHARQAGNELNLKLLASGLKPKNYDVQLRDMRSQVELFREANLPLFVEIEKLLTDYNKIIGAQTVEWEGEEVTLNHLATVLQDLDRSKREKAWRLRAERRLQDRAALHTIWVKLLELRHQVALNAGKVDYRAYAWHEKNRFDYTPEDCNTFHQAIEQVVVPATQKLAEKRRQQLGLDQLRNWDMDVDPLGHEALRPYSTIDELITTTSRIFHQVDPTLGNYFDIMRDKGLLDLENRKGKAPGGYCTFFPIERVPFIFMNAVGLADDIRTMLHEGGHAFHVFEASQLPYFRQLDIENMPMEFAEVGSMAMELLASPYLPASKGGFFTEEEAIRAENEHLEGILYFWPYMAIVDAFQHWVYTHLDEAKDADKCDTKWLELWQRFKPEEDIQGIEAEIATRWRAQSHIFSAPFYYIEYGLAELGAVQVWANALKDQANAIANYRKSLQLGATATLPELFNAAGANFAFDSQTLGEAVELLMSQIAQLV